MRRCAPRGPRTRSCPARATSCGHRSTPSSASPSCWRCLTSATKTATASRGSSAPGAISSPSSTAVQCSAARCDEARFVGQHDGLDTVAEAEFGQYPSDVDLYGPFGQMQVGGDLAVGSPGGQLGEDGSFSAGELAEQGVPVVLPARIGQEGDELVDEPPRRCGCEHRVAAGDGADGGEQISRWRVFEEESAGARLESGEDV